jgi:CRISPR-associated protein Csd1
MHHAAKAEGERRGWAERVKAQIVDRLPAAEAFPRTLGLEDQGRFAVGYYHQRQAFFTPRAERESVRSTGEAETEGRAQGASTHQEGL